MRPFPDRDVPGYPHRNCSTPLAVDAIDLLGGGTTSNGTAFSADELRHLERAYGYDEAADRASAEEAQAIHAASVARAIADHEAMPAGLRPMSPRAPRAFSPESAYRFMRAGGQVNLLRRVERDGLRVMGLLSRYLDGGDPVKLVARLLVDASYDVDPAIVDWCEGDGE